MDGIPGLNSRAVATTVDLREGQWLAIAGLIQDQQGGSKGRIPFLGDIPFFGAPFMNESVRREETELVVLVSPELVHPMECKQVPLILPGMDVTEPNDKAFFCLQQIEGHPDVQHRSTVWPAYRDRLREAGFQAVHANHGPARPVLSAAALLHVRPARVLGVTPCGLVFRETPVDSQTARENRRNRPMFRSPVKYATCLCSLSVLLAAAGCTTPSLFYQPPPPPEMLGTKVDQIDADPGGKRGGLEVRDLPA